MPNAEAAHDMARAPARKSRGGARQGGGVKAADGVATRRVQLTLDADTLAVFAQLGGGNVSLGAREAARMARAMSAGVAVPTPGPACTPATTV